MKLLQNPFIIFGFVWSLLCYLGAFLTSNFYLFPLGLFPLALYELFRTEGIKNTRPLSFLTSLLLGFQFLHTANIMAFPFKINFLTDLLPAPLPASTDPFVFTSSIILVLFAVLLIRYTWGSVTKFLAIILLLGSLIEAYLFWPEIQMIINSPGGQELLKSTQIEVEDNLIYRLKRELF